MIDSAKRVDEALQIGKISFPPQPRIVKIEWEPDEDTSGEESLDILVLLDSQTTDDEIRAAPIQEMKWRIIESLRSHGVMQSAYFTFERQGERAALSEGD